MQHERLPAYLANRPFAPNEALEVTDKFRGHVACRVPLCDAAAIAAAIAAADAARPALAAMSATQRREVLAHCGRRLAEDAEALAQTLCCEAGKPIRDSRGEVARLIDTFRVAAEEAGRIPGEVINMDATGRGEGYRGWVRRVPIGPCSFISPFNFPLNLAAHKIAPALAAGCPFVLKPASLTPMGALQIGAILAETDLPKGAFSILPCRRDGAELFCSDPRLKLLSFTGSPKVGWALKARAGKMKVVLELGGNAACIVADDADVDDAVARVLAGAFYQSGQSCIKTQRVLVHRSLYGRFADALVARTEALVVGDPRHEDTFVGPLIAAAEATRLAEWVATARAGGARLLCGGGHDGALMQPTLLDRVPAGAAVAREEAFGPVTVLSAFDDFEAALAEVNDSAYGLQAGLFTFDMRRIMRAWDVLEVGGVLVNEVPSFRVDHMPYGGVKDSGLGREGVRYAIEDMTEPRLLVVRCS